MTDTLTILEGDCVEQLRTLPDESVQCVVTSPPYDNARTYGQAKLAWDFEGAARELFRVIAPGGIVCWNVGDMVIDGSETLTSFRQAIYFKDKCGFKVHDTMIYEKSNGSKPNPSRYNQCFEYVFVLCKGKPRTVNLIADKPNVTAGLAVFGKHTMRERDGSLSVRKNRIIAKEYGVRTNVWKGNTRAQEQVCEELPHPAMMPKWLARDLIISFSNPGDLILDPFGGSGTTAVAALEAGRRALTWDVNPEYVELIKQACAKAQPPLIAA